MIQVARWRLPQTGLTPVAVGAWAAAIALTPDPAWKVLIAGPVLAGAVAWWTILSAERWLALFFFCAILLPPLPGAGAFGNSSVHIAPLFALAGIFVGVLRVTEWRAWRGPLPLALFVFLSVLTGSVAFAALYSGWTIAIGSLSRVLLFAVGLYVFLYTFIGPREENANPMRFARYLFLAGALGALFACIDFYFQLPAPANYGAQFIWVGQDVFRRAHGLFYEASTLGNFCAFFLVMFSPRSFGLLRNGPVRGLLSLPAASSSRPL